VASGPQVSATFTADTSAFVSNVAKASTATQNFQAATGKASEGLSVFKVAAGTALGNLAVQGVNRAVGAIKGLIGGSFQAAARVEELNVAMEAIGYSTGKGADAIRQAAKDVKKNGIEMATAQQIAIQFAQANLDLADAQKVSRVAQDLAVVAGLNSTETTQRLTTAIITGNSELLRATGIAKTAAQAYEEYGAANGKSAQNLTAVEKQQAMVNLIMAEGEKVAGTYDASMNSAGKVLRSFPRIFNDIQVSIGTVLSGAFGPLVLAAYHALKAFSALLEEGGAFYPFLQMLKDSFIQLVQPIMAFVGHMQGVFQNKERMQELADKLTAIFNIVKALAPSVVILVGAFMLMRAVPAIFQAVSAALKMMTIQQIRMNLAAYANPYVAIAIAVIAVFALLAAAFKFVYDRSEQLRIAVDSFLKTAMKLVNIIKDTVVKAFQDLFGGMGSASKKTQSFGDIIQKVVDILSTVFQGYLKALITYWKVLASVIQVVIKVIEVLVRFVIMLASFLRLALAAAVKWVGERFTWLLDHLGPVGEWLKKVGAEIKKFFANIPEAVRGFIAGIKPMFESWINTAIDFINKLIDAYNKIPGVTTVTRISAFKFADMTDVEGKDPNKVIDATEGRDSKIRRGNGKTDDGPPGPPGPPGPGNEDAAAQKFAERMKEYAQKVIDAIKAMSEAWKSLMALTEQPFGEKSQIEKAFGSESSIDGVIGMYNQLKGVMTDFYESEASAAGANADDIRNIMELKIEYLREAAAEIIDLMRQRDQAMKDIQKAQDDAGKKIEQINAKYDELDKAAAASIKKLEDKWAATIKAIEAQVAEANAAFEKENAVLKTLIDERDNFAKKIVDGFRQFVNNLSVTDEEVSGGGGFREALEKRLEAVREFNANIQALLKRGLDPTLVREFIEAGPAQAGKMVSDLVAGSDDNLAAINQTQKDLATETQAFAKVASSQYYDAAVAQQEALVEPLRAWLEFSQTALAQAQAQRDSELAAAQAYADRLKTDREKEIKAAESARDAEVARLRTLIEQLNAEIDTKAKAIQQYFTKLQETWPSEMTKLGYAAMDSLAAAIENRKGKIAALAAELGNTIHQAIRNALNMHSPSRVMISVGEDIAEGIAIGMQNGARSVMAAANGLSAATMPQMNSTISGLSANGAGAPVTIQPGAVQISFAGSLDSMSAEQIQLIVDESLMKLAREIRRT